jgi:hypothetical protein
MENPEVIKIIENLRGRRPYEEKRAAKLGFNSLHEYIEDKIQKKQLTDKNFEETECEASKVDSQSKNKSCGCC